MRKLSLLFILPFLISIRIQAQIILCHDIALEYTTDSMTFSVADPISFGDSMITFHITNQHPTQGFAYPLAKLVPLTPLPAGMSLSVNNQPWSVFASSWNPGVTMPVYIFYEVEENIPLNYEVTFEVWVSNLSPLIVDSCYFEETFTINLNPFNTSINSSVQNNKVNLFPNPAENFFKLNWENQLTNDNQIKILNSLGTIILETIAISGTNSIELDIKNLTSGIYFISISELNETEQLHKLIIE